MSLVNILSIQVLDNPSRFTNPFQFEIAFECIAPLQEGSWLKFEIIDLEWNLIYVGSAEDEKYDQILDTILVGPIPVGINKFVFQVCSSNFILGRSSKLSNDTSGGHFGGDSGPFDLFI